MSAIGILSLYVPGHVHPALALGSALAARGHQVSFFNVPDLAEAAARTTLRFVPFGAEHYPPGALREAQAKISALQGQAGFAYFVERMGLLARTAFAELPALLASAQLDLLIVDQLFPGGSTLAERAGLRYATLAAALIVNREDSVPPPILAWPYDPSPAGIERNRQGWAGVSQAFAPLLALVNGQRAEWGLPLHNDFLEDSFSPLLTISQQAPGFEFPRTQLAPTVHLVGPLRLLSVMPPAAFPWDKLDSRPLVYASLGTLQNGLPHVFAAIVQALAELPVQAVVSTGASSVVTPESLAPLPDHIHVVPFAPQEELLRRAALCITHAGLNTVTDCLQHGVPMVAVPIASEQPGIAARIVWSGTGLMVPLAELSAERLRAAVVQVLATPGFRERAGDFAETMRGLHPLEDASERIEALL